jgi:hypothetical protein
MKPQILAIALLLTPPLLLSAAERPATRPAPERWRHNAAGGMNTTPPTDAEWKETIAFMQQHAPLRAKLLHNSDPKRQGARLFIFNHYKALKQLEKDDPQIYNLRVNNMELEDAAFGLLQEWKKETDAQKKEALRTELRKKVSALTSNWITERENRIAHLEQSLEREKERLEADKKNLDQKIDERLEHFLKDGFGPPEREPRPFNDRRREPPPEKRGEE